MNLLTMRMTPLPTTFRRRHRARGFSLVEILVGLIIGLFATIVIMQMFIDSERRNRTNAGTADAQSNGIIAFYQLQSNIQKAGYGINAVNLLNCPVQWNVANGNLISQPIPLAPVTINPVAANGAALIPPGDTGTDTLLIFFGNGNSQPQGSKLSGAPAATVYPLQSAADLAVGNRVLLSPDMTMGSCTGTLTVDRVTAVNANMVSVALGGGAAGAAPALYNLGAGPDGPNAAPTAAAPINGPTILAYAIRNQTLTVCDYSVNDCSLAASASSSQVWVPMANNIVSMRAVYLKDTATPMTGMPTSHQTQLGTTPPSITTTACDWVRASAINLALVSRSAEIEHNPENPTLEFVTNEVTGPSGVANAPTWSDDAIAPLSTTTSAWRTNLGDPDQWRKYRYRTFETIVPIRNISWMGVPGSC